ncbi:MAG: hypothetical protein Q8R21_05830, partial [Burkholderiales bacterium]|nr:hypothetical protein [Burkholderiales bacterium]
ADVVAGQQFEGFVCIAGGEYVVAVFLQHDLRQHQVIPVVVDNQDCRFLVSGRWFPTRAVQRVA